MDPFYESDRDGHGINDFFAGSVCDHPFPAHMHDAVEIIYVVNGSMDVTIGNKRIMLMPGDTAVAFPGVIHSYDYVSDDIEGIMIMFLPGIIDEYNTLFRTMRPKESVIKLVNRHPDMDGIIRHLAELTDKRLKAAYLHVVLACVTSKLELIPADKQPVAKLTDNVLQYVGNHYTEALSLENTAEALGISRIYLSHIFSQQLHINFRQYINMLRINMACKLMRDPAETITQIALECGYENQRTFHRAFLDQCGMKPNEYRAKLRNKEASEDDKTNKK